MTWRASQRLAHEARLKAHRGVSNLSLNLCTRHEGGDGVYDHNVNGARPDKHVANLERLLAGVWLGDEHLVNVYTDASRITWVKRVLGVNESDNATHSLRLGKDLE